MVYHEVHVPHGLSEPEFEEIMSRNRLKLILIRHFGSITSNLNIGNHTHVQMH